MGLGLPQFRETVQRQVLEFLDKENLAPEDCCISWHTEPYGKDENGTLIVAQVYYQK